MKRKEIDMKERRQINERDMKRMNIPERYWEVNFSNIVGNHKEIIYNYCANLDLQLENGNGLLLYGPNGCGKTSIAVVLAKESRRRGWTVYFQIFSSLIEQIKEKGMFDEGYTVLERALDVDLLILDDIGKEYRTDSGFVEKTFERIVRERIFEEKAIIFTTNMDLGTLKDIYKPSTIEVLKESVVPILIEGNDFRKEKVIELKKIVGL